VTNTHAYQDGGTFYVLGTSVQTLNIDGMIISDTKAERNGGMMYLDNPN
jgi:hypothetical protein